MSTITAPSLASDSYFTQGLTRFLALANDSTPSFLKRVPVRGKEVVVKTTTELFLRERVRYIKYYRKGRGEGISGSQTIDEEVKDSETIRVRVPAGSKLERCASTERAYIANVELLDARGGVELVQLTVEFTKTKTIDRLLIRHYSGNSWGTRDSRTLPRGYKLA